MESDPRTLSCRSEVSAITHYEPPSKLKPSPFTRAESPSPDRYKIQSAFDSNEKAARNAYFGKTRRTFCFGAGRDDFSRTVYNTGNMYPDRVVPGPGSYTDKTQDTGVNGVKYTLKQRKFYMTDEETAIKRAVPPPGTYEDQQALDKKGNYASSQMV